MNPLRIAALALVVAPGPLLAQDAAADYVVHEWGTFTSMVGTDGSVLEGLQREEAALPPFVHDLARLCEVERGQGKFPASRVTQKMETPVIYFHAEAPLRVCVEVHYQNGLMTQFYPLPAWVEPDLATLQHTVDVHSLDDSALIWDIDVMPRTAPAPREIPAVADDDPWAAARAVRSCWVRTHEGGTSAAEAEHYLFYRGIGCWQPALQLRPCGDGAWSVQNGMDAELPFCALLELDAAGGRFAVGGPIGAGGDRRLSLGDRPRIADRTQFAGEIGDAVQKALIKSGLFEDEALAMVATWSRSWFQHDGARLIYVLPRAAVDAVLPLRLLPAPRELVRTIVGRLEFITPAVQRAVEDDLIAEAAGGATAAAATARLGALDRFLEPQLRNVVGNGRDPGVRTLASARLATLPK